MLGLAGTAARRPAGTAPAALLRQPPVQAGPAVAAGLTALAMVTAGAAPAAAHAVTPGARSASASAAKRAEAEGAAIVLGSKGAGALSAQLGLRAEKRDLEATVEAANALSAVSAGRFSRKVEEYAPYEREAACFGEVQPGLVALRELVKGVFGGADADYGTLRACSDNLGGHEQGSALDWMVDARDEKERVAGLAFLQWLLAADADGTEHANARRLGVMYVIWNDRIWSAERADEGWRPYLHWNCVSGGAAACSPTLRHLDHIHLSLSPAGAAKRTSFWTARGKAPAGVLAGSLGGFPGLAYTGRGDRNEHVLRYEQRLHALGRLEEELVDGRMGRATLEASRELQQRAGLVVDGVVGPLTWAAANKAVRAPVLEQQPPRPGPAGAERGRLRLDARGSGAWFLPHRSPVCCCGLCRTRPGSGEKGSRRALA